MGANPANSCLKLDKLRRHPHEAMRFHPAGQQPFEKSLIVQLQPRIGAADAISDQRDGTPGQHHDEIVLGQRLFSAGEETPGSIFVKAKPVVEPKRSEIKGTAVGDQGNRVKERVTKGQRL